jgi:hypothetical protein
MEREPPSYPANSISTNLASAVDGLRQSFVKLHQTAKSGRENAAPLRAALADRKIKY